MVFFKFIYTRDGVVRKTPSEKLVLLDRNTKWDLRVETEYLLVDPELLELKTAIIVKKGNFVQVVDIPFTYEETSLSRALVYSTEDNPNSACEISLYARKKRIYQGEAVSLDSDYKTISFGLTGSEDVYKLLDKNGQQMVDDFRAYVAWIHKNQLETLRAAEDFSARRGFRLKSKEEVLTPSRWGASSGSIPGNIHVDKIEISLYLPVFQEGFEPSSPEGVREVKNKISTLSLEESGLPFLFRPVWKSPSLMVGYISVAGEKIEGLVKRPGDGTGLYLDAVLYLGLMEIPPANLAEADMAWLNNGGKICWVYYSSSNENVIADLIRASTKETPTDQSGWVKIVNRYDEAVHYLKEKFENQDYIALVEESRARSLAAHFEKQISSHVSIPDEVPFYSYGTTELGKALASRLNSLKAEMIDGLTVENAVERIEETKIKAEEIKANLRMQYENARALIAETEKAFEKKLAEIETGLVVSEINEINELLKNARTHIGGGAFERAEQGCHEASYLIGTLAATATKRGQQKNAERERLGIPQSLLDVFKGDLAIALEFMTNVSRIETWRIDAHELTCGRERSRTTCEAAWDAMGETSSFFCGADPNDVKYYVYERHFGEDAIPVIRLREKEGLNKNLTTSSDAMTEALRKAGLLDKER